jgi:hypothetical protein
MTQELHLLEDWIPEEMEPGTLFVLENAEDRGYWAVIACPRCAALGLITSYQFAGLENVICGSENCSAEYFLIGDEIRFRSPN